MKKKLLSLLCFIFYIFIMYLIQLFLIDNNEIFGVKPNLVLITCIIFTIFNGVYKGTVFSFLIGLFTDLIFGLKSIFTISYTLTSLIVGFFVKENRKDDKIFLIGMTFFSTALFELIQYIIYAVTSKVFSNVFYLLKQVLISSILNIVIVFFVYKVIYEISEFFERRQKRDMNGF